MAKTFNYSTVRVKNEHDEYEDLPALRGDSSYELAVQNGFEGTEEEWMELMVGSGWVGAVQKLEADMVKEEDVYTREQTLTNETKTLFGMDASALPDDIYQKILMNTSCRVGDIKSSIRTDLSDDWALCNGATFDPELYPELAAVTPDQESLMKLGEYRSTPHPQYSNGSIQSFCEANGYQVVTVNVNTSGSYYLFVCYSTDWFKTYTWNTTSIMYNPTTSVIRYIDGTWIIGAGYTGGGSYNIQLYTTTNITSTSWTSRGSLYYFYYVYDIWKDPNGYICVAGAGNSSESEMTAYGRIAYSTSVTANSSNYQYIQGSSKCYPNDFVRANGYYTFIGSYQTSNRYVCYTTSIFGPWTVKNISISASGATLGSEVVRNINYDEKEGIWYSNGSVHKTVNNSTVYYPAIFWTRDITSSSWTATYSTFPAISGNTTGSTLYQVGFARDYYVGSTSAQYFWLMPSLIDSSGWKVVKSELTLNDSNRTMLPIVFSDRVIFTSGCGFAILPLYCLPNLPEDTHYNYIKVK